MATEFDVRECLERIRESDSYFYTFMDRDSMAAGVLALRPGEEDTQEPHDCDEMYYVVSGDGHLRIGGRDHAVSEGKMFFVKKGTVHRFHGNTRQVTAVYFFAGQ